MWLPPARPVSPQIKSPYFQIESAAIVVARWDPQVGYVSGTPRYLVLPHKHVVRNPAGANPKPGMILPASDIQVLNAPGRTFRMGIWRYFRRLGRKDLGVGMLVLSVG